MTATRAEVYAAIDSEREYQDRLWTQVGSTNGQPNQLTKGEFLLLLEEYLARARAAWTQEPKPEVNTLEVIRKIAGIAVNCMEQHGAPHRAPGATSAKAPNVCCVVPPGDQSDP